MVKIYFIYYEKFKNNFYSISTYYLPKYFLVFELCYYCYVSLYLLLKAYISKKL